MVDAIFRVWSSFYDNPVQQKLYFRPIQAAVLAELGPSPGRVLDLGCGTGELLAQLGGQRAVGADLSLDMLRKALAKPGQDHPVVAVDGHALPFADGSLDAIACLVSFQYYLRPLDALSEMCRALKPGGRLLLAALSTSALEARWVSDALRSATGGMVRVYAPSELTGLVEEAGFTRCTHRLVRPFTRLFVALK